MRWLYLVALYLTFVSVALASPWDILFSKPSVQYSGILVLDTHLYLITPETSNYELITDKLLDYLVIGDKLLVAERESSALVLRELRVNTGRQLRRRKLRRQLNDFVGLYSLGTRALLATRNKVWMITENLKLKELLALSGEELQDLLAYKGKLLVLTRHGDKWFLKIYQSSKDSQLRLKRKVVLEAGERPTIYPYAVIGDLFVFSEYSLKGASDEDEMQLEITWKVNVVPLREEKVPVTIAKFKSEGFSEYFSFSIDGYSEDDSYTLAISNGFITSILKGSLGAGFKDAGSYPGNLVALFSKGYELITERYGKIILYDLKSGTSFGFSGNSPVLFSDGSLIFYRFKNGKVLLYKYDPVEGLIKFLMAVDYSYVPEVFSYQAI